MNTTTDEAERANAAVDLLDQDTVARALANVLSGEAGENAVNSHILEVVYGTSEPARVLGLAVAWTPTVYHYALWATRNAVLHCVQMHMAPGDPAIPLAVAGLLDDAFPGR